ncbi:Beta/gamma crystallin domain containing protein 2 [Dissostichus eleginoides]|uniref:Beta/gamma crystallin domain containing protein 2 n=1 Tax=Dissostichus eleginoides TaxID=100907 RepID=A0AAD9BTR6_DISEL|nr:Beta/gamma crystallin domain containing protein 2 [Dissostichus eleginoides]
MDQVTAQIFQYLGEAQLQHQAVSHELDVLLHQIAFHPVSFDGQRLRQELLREGEELADGQEAERERGGGAYLLDGHGVPDDVTDGVFRRFVHQVFEHQTGKVTVKTLNAPQNEHQTGKITVKTLNAPQNEHQTGKVTVKTLNAPQNEHQTGKVTVKTLNAPQSEHQTGKVTVKTLNAPQNEHETGKVTVKTLNAPQSEHETGKVTVKTLNAPQ